MKNVEPKAFGVLAARVDAKQEVGPGVHRRDPRAHSRSALQENGIRRGDQGPHQKHLQYSPEDEATEDRARSSLRFHCPCASSTDEREETVTARSASFTTPGDPFRDASRTSSPCLGPTATVRSTHERHHGCPVFPSRSRSVAPEMNRVAEQGIAAHWKYKEGRPFEEDDVKNFAWLRQIIDWQRRGQGPPRVPQRA